MSIIMGWFKQAKIFIIAIFGALIAGYVISENLKRKRAEAKLIDLQNGITKTQINIIKTQAKVASETKDLEMNQHNETLTKLQENKKIAKQELEEATNRMNDTADHNGRVGIFTFDGLTPVKDKV